MLVKVYTYSITAGETGFAKDMLQPFFKLEYIAQPSRTDTKKLTNPA